MQIGAVQSYEYGQQNSCYRRQGSYLSTVTGATAVGAAAGWAAKHIIPLTLDEKAILEQFKEVGDAFVKSDTLKNILTEPAQKKLIDQLGSSKKFDVVASSIIEKNLKSIRPTLQMALAGASIGFFIGVCRNVFRTDIAA